MQRIAACYALVVGSLVLGGCRNDHAAPLPPTSSPCEVGGVELAHGSTRVFFSASEVPAGEVCVQAARTCQNGTLAGDPAFAFTDCTVSDAHTVFLRTGGDDTHHGLSEADAVASLSRALEIAHDQEKRGIVVDIGAGTFPHDGELRITSGVSLRGAGPSTLLDFDLERTEASIRILASDVELSSLAINVHLVHSLSGCVENPNTCITGGRGEFGTGVTVGAYLQTEAPLPIERVTLRDLVIGRDGGDDVSYLAAAMTLVGRVSDITISGIELRDRHSTGLIAHWGGWSTVAPAPEALQNPDYALLETYHPHRIDVTGLTFERLDAITALSSTYDVRLQNLSGRTSRIALLLPGDEVDVYATEEDRGNINKNLTISDVEVDISARPGRPELVRITANGTSKIDDTNGTPVVRTLPYEQVTIEDVTVLSVDTSQADLHYGIDANGAQGTDIVLRNIVLGAVATGGFPGSNGPVPGVGLHIRNATGLRIDNLQTQADVGVVIRDSDSIRITELQASWSPWTAPFNTFGIVIDQTPAAARPLADIQVAGGQLEGYPTGVRYDADVGCGPLTISMFTAVDIATLEAPISCGAFGLGM